VATVTRTATRTKTREQNLRNEHRRPPPGFIPGGGLRRAGTTSARPAHFDDQGGQRGPAGGGPPTRWSGGCGRAARPMPLSHTGPSRPRFTYLVQPNRTKHPSSCTTNVKCRRPPARRRSPALPGPARGVRVCGAGVVGGVWDRGRDDVVAEQGRGGGRSGAAGRPLPGLRVHCPGASISKARKGHLREFELRSVVT
jgi:hypothetical protein